MAYQPALDESELHRLNLRSIRDWIERNKGKIKAKPGKSVFYAGREFNIELTKGLPDADRDAINGTPMWKCVAQMNKHNQELKVPCEFETLEDVLKSIRDYPAILDRDRQEQSFSSAYACFNGLESIAKLLPDAKRVARACWDRLSEIYAGNAVGDIQILDGLADDARKLQEDKILIRKELEALLRNNKLSREGKAVLEKKISMYGAHFDRRYTELIRRLSEERLRLKKR